MDEKGSYTINPIPQEYINTKRHFFGTPKMENLEHLNNQNMGNTNNTTNPNNNNTQNQNVNNNNNLNNNIKSHPDLNMDQYIENLNNSEIRDPYYFNNKFIPNKNVNNKLIQLEVTESDIINILEKFHKISKKMGFEIESSILNCFKDKKNTDTGITNEMVTFYLKVRYELDEIELQKILIFYSDNGEDMSEQFKLDDFVDLIRKFNDDKMKMTKRGNPFENNIYNMNESAYNMKSRTSRSPPNKSARYGDESFKLGKFFLNFLIINFLIRKNFE